MRDRSVFTAVCLLGFAALIAAASGLPLIWDGGYQLAVTLAEQRPYVYLTRFHTAALWWPAVWMSQLTESPRLIVMAYGLPFLLAPAVAVAASAWFLRGRRAELIPWAIFGSALSLPGQVFVINDSIWQHTLAWPLFLGALVPLSRGQRAAWLVLGACQFPHQAGLLLLAACTFGAWVAGEKWQRVAAAALFALAVAKAVWVSVPAWSGPLFDSYAAQEASTERMWLCFRTGVLWLPLAGVALLWLAGAALVAGRTVWVWVLSLVLAGVWLWWVAWPGLWLSAINYRRWVVPLAGPLFLLAAWHAWRVKHGAARLLEGRWMDRSAVLVAGLVLVVLAVQSWHWHELFARFRAEAQSAGQAQLERADFPWMRETVLDHWGLTSSHLVWTGPAPRQHFAWEPAMLPEPGAAPAVAIAATQRIAVERQESGWFDFRALWERLRRSEAAR
jgi:hypothetical protein